MFGPKLNSKSYTTFLLIVMGVLLSLNLFAQMGQEERYDSTAAQREIAASNQSVAAATDRVATANQAIASAIQQLALAVDGRRSFDVNVTMADDGTPASTGSTPVVGSSPEDEQPRGTLQLR